MDYSHTFNRFFDYLMQVEGVESNDPDDRGGHTRFGISKAAHPDVDIHSLTRSQAKAIYYRQYWCKAQCPAMPPVVAFCLADGVVNHGLKLGVTILQRALGERSDGVIGPKTLAAAQRAGKGDQGPFVALYGAARRDVYRRIVAKRPSQQRFIKGWLNRVDRLEAACRSVISRQTRTSPVKKNLPVAATGVLSFVLTFFMVLRQELGDVDPGTMITLIQLLDAVGVALPAAILTSWAHKSKSPNEDSLS